MADTTYRERIEALTFNNDEASWWPDRTQSGPGDLRTDDERLAFIDGYSASKRDASAIAAEADAEIGEARAAVDPEIDRGLPLHERIVILRMQRDSFAQFADEVAKIVGMEGEGGNDVLDAIKKAVAERDAGERILDEQAIAFREKSNALVKVIAEADDLRERLALGEAELANLRGIPEQWSNACEERDAARRIVSELTGWPYTTLIEVAADMRRRVATAQQDPRIAQHEADDLAGIMDGSEMMPNDGERVRGGGDE